jgi:predicted ester cyclase
MSEQASGPGEVVVEMIRGMVSRGDEALAPHPGMGHLRRLWPSVKSAIPDFDAELQQQVVEGDQVATHWIFSGTHEGELFGVAPTGKAVRFQNVSIARVEGGKVVQYNSETGWLDFLMQVGVLPFGK